MIDDLGNRLVQKIMIPCDNEITEKISRLHHELFIFKTTYFIIPEIINNVRLIKFNSIKK